MAMTARKHTEQAGAILGTREKSWKQQPDWLVEAIERGKRGPFALIADIAPEDAKRLLAANPKNRHVTLGALGKIVRDIDAGRWQFNGESIVVADTGELNDGQHRLAAIEATNKAVRSVIVFGVPRESRETLDTGKARDASDWIAMHGIHYAALNAATARLVFAYERSRGTDFKRVSHFSVGEIMDRVLGDLELQAAATHLGRDLQHVGRDILPGSVGAACLYLMGRVDPAPAEHFIDRLMIGDRLQRDDAIYRTRRALMLTTERKRGHLAACVLRGWASWRGKHCAIVPEYPLPPLT